MNGKKLKQLRIMNDHSQTSLAKIVGVSRQYYNLVENEKVVPSLNLATRIAKALNCSVKDFF